MPALGRNLLEYTVLSIMYDAEEGGTKFYDIEEWNQFIMHPDMTTLGIFHTNCVQTKSRGGRKYRREKEHILGILFTPPFR